MDDKSKGNDPTHITNNYNYNTYHINNTVKSLLGNKTSYKFNVNDESFNVNDESAAQKTDKSWERFLAFGYSCLGKLWNKIVDKSIEIMVGSAIIYTINEIPQ